MEIENNDIDNMLQDLGIETPTESNFSSSDNTMEASAFSEGDVSSILEENGFNCQSSEDDGETYDENQGEGGDLETENQMLLEEARNNFVQALDEEEESSEAEAVEEEVRLTEETRVSEDVKIPLNSPTLLMDESTSRFSGAEWFNEIQKQRIIVAGIGGIGSNLCFQLARMTPANITMYDSDKVEMVNMAGQLYSMNDIGKAKVDAIANMISSYTTMRQINAIKDWFTEDTEAGDIMICGFDNMRARRIFFNSWLEHVKSKDGNEERKKCLFMDGRLSMDILQILCIRGDDIFNINRYQKEFLFLDSEADATVCSMKQTTYLACMIGSLMTNLFTNFVANQLDPVIPYDLPFFTEYDAQNMIFKTEN